MLYYIVMAIIQSEIALADKTETVGKISIMEGSENNDYYGLGALSMNLFGKIMSHVQPAINSVWGNYFEISEIIPNLYIGDFSSACDTEKLKGLGITTIITVFAGVGEMYPHLFKYRIIDICDRKYVDISMHFDPTSDYIENSLKSNEKILVHCQKGASRSATIVAAYLIKKKGYTSERAIQTIKEKRSCVCPNSGFIKQLNDYEYDMKHKL
jgi:hypothetical protein